MTLRRETVLCLFTLGVAVACSGDGEDSGKSPSDADPMTGESGGNSSNGGETMRSGGASSGGNETGGGGSGDGGSPAGTGGTAQEPIEPFEPSQRCLDLAADLVAQMTLQEKAGQMVQPEADHVAEGEAADYFLGSVLLPGHARAKTNEAVTEQATRLRTEALSTRLGIPLAVAIDAIHGNAMVIDNVVFPHNIGLGATRNPELVRDSAEITAQEAAGSGLGWTFAPVLAAAQDIRWGRTYESFAEDPELAAQLGEAAVRGYQSSDPQVAAGNVFATAKHFAGDGTTAFGTSLRGTLDQGDTQLDDEEFRRLAVDQYQASIEAGVASVMISYSSLNVEKLHGSHKVVTELLKEELGFQGIVISDYLAIRQLSDETFQEQVESSVNAGLDILMGEYTPAIDAIIAGVGSGAISEERINDANSRILMMKCEMGLFDEDYQAEPPESLADQIGSDERRDVARQAVRESMVLLKNENSALPLDKGANIHVMGSAADNLTFQCGGWTIDWGGSGSRTCGTTLLTALRDSVDDPSQVTTGEIPDDADVIVVAIGEPPYAEYIGDRSDLPLPFGAPEDLAAAQASGLPVVAVLFSGRPLFLESEIDQADAWVAAWLPGTEGDGITDVLFADANFTGQLSFTWPRNVEQLPLLGKASIADPQFPFGHGLSYPDAAVSNTLREAVPQCYYTPGYCESRAPFGSSEPLIDDIEGGTDEIPGNDGRRGYWSFAFDGTPGGDFEPFGNPATTDDAHSGSYSIHNIATGWGDDWGAGVRLYGGSSTCFFNASAYDGVEFWARSGSGSAQTMRFAAQTVGLTETSDRGFCEGDGCQDWHSAEFTLETTWTRHVFLWSELVQDDGVDHDNKYPFAPEDLNSLLWYAPSGEFDIYIDDVSFITE